jgi:predicted TIM-barrel fold metal-dependent hydrolase
MIVDCHVHSDWTWPYLGGIFKKGTMEDLSSMAKQVGVDKLCTSSVKAIEYDFVEGNSDLLQLMKEAPELILGYCTLSPYFGDVALEEFDRCVLRGGMVGVKMYPVINYWRADETSVFPLIEKIVKARVPALIHSEPLDALINLADRFPDATILVAHSGTGCTSQNAAGIIQDVKRRENLYLDTATSHLEANLVPEAVRVLGADRVVYGTDYPLLEPNAQIHRVKSAKISEEDKRLILGDNMMRLFGRKRASA